MTTERDAEARLAEALRRLELLERMEAARGLLHDYGARVDEQDVDGVVALFRPDAVLENPRGTFVGSTAIAGTFRDAWAEEPAPRRHFITVPKIVDAGASLLEVAAQFHFVGRGQERSILGWGTYSDRVDISGETPLFAARRIVVHLATDLEAGWPL